VFDLVHRTGNREVKAKSRVVNLCNMRRDMVTSLVTQGYPGYVGITAVFDTFVRDVTCVVRIVA
jgi:hypothetical protein